MINAIETKIKEVTALKKSVTLLLQCHLIDGGVFNRLLTHSSGA